jgi:hypothetical protein
LLPKLEPVTGTPNTRSAKFPRRTLILMVLALAAFTRLWCVTHPDDGAATPAASSLETAP